MHTIKVSIIIPVYNASLHLEQCIHSVLTQTLQEIEVIIVNDGSTDDSLTIIRKFEKQEERVVVIDSPNEGVSAARNKGLEIARGDYIGFVDADDWVEQEMFETLYERAVISEADIAICNVNLIKENTENQTRLILEPEEFDLENSREFAISNLMQFKYDFANWNKIYLRAFVIQKEIQFNTGMKVWEDLLFNLYYFSFAKKGVIVNAPLYNYREHALSVMNTNRHDTIGEYNQLFENFNNFCSMKGFMNERSAFNKEMRRGFYYAVIPKVFSEIKEMHHSAIKSARLFSQELYKVNSELFSFDPDEINGWQGIKKKLLKKKAFRLFSLLIAAKG